MIDTTTQKLITQLRTLQQLTNTEAQIAQTRQVQARDEAVRDELATNAANAHERAQLIAAALGDLGGVPDVVTRALGRATALAKTVVEQGQPIAGALFGDLALEHQLLDRARYLEALADTADHDDTRNLTRRLQAAHQETIDWITSVLVEEASGKPTKVRAPRSRRQWDSSPAWLVTRPAGALNGSTGPPSPWPAPAHGSAPPPQPGSIP